MSKEPQEKTFTLINDQTGEKTTLPVIEGTYGPHCIDVRKLYAQTEHFTFDPSFTSTGSCKSKITYIDGDKGILLHRGYNIKELALKSSYMEVCHLLLHGELPNKEKLEEFTGFITNHTMIHEQVKSVYQGFRRDATRWRLCAGLLEQWPPSTMTRWISGILNNAVFPRIA